ncbi:MAG: hypothetical protein HKP27_16245 [Myxococcales bacterium]|nr:hypothetical protein [Myxococcales bacterium]
MMSSSGSPGVAVVNIVLGAVLPLAFWILCWYFAGRQRRRAARELLTRDQGPGEELKILIEAFPEVVRERIQRDDCWIVGEPHRRRGVEYLGPFDVPRPESSEPIRVYGKMPDCVNSIEQMHWMVAGDGAE